MELQVLAREISVATGIGAKDISSIIAKCFNALANNSGPQTTLIIPQSNNEQNTYLITRI